MKVNDSKISIDEITEVLYNSILHTNYFINILLYM